MDKPKFLDDWRKYGKWSDDVSNNVVLVKQETIYMGLILAIILAIITYLLDLFILIFNDYFKIELNQYLWLILRIIILFIILSIYVNYVQYSKFKEAKL